MRPTVLLDARMTVFATRTANPSIRFRGGLIWKNQLAFELLTWRVTAIQSEWIWVMLCRWTDAKMIGTGIDGYGLFQLMAEKGGCRII